MITNLLPRLANLVALRSTDAAARQRFAEKLRARSYRVHTPAALWVVGVRDLPGSTAVDERDERDGMFFAEGQECLPPADEARASARAQLHTTSERAPSSREDADDLTFLSIRPDGSATFQRSLGGRVPCYHWQRGDDLVLCTDSRELIRIAEHEGTPDGLLTGLALSGGYLNDVEGRSHLLGVRKLGKADGLAIDCEGRTRGYEHWRPLAFEALQVPTRDQRRERLVRFRNELLRVVDTGLTATGRNLLSLSGGVDSSLLLAIAVGTFHRPVASVSVVPTPDDRAFTREMERIRWLRASFPTDPHLSFSLFSEEQLQRWQQLQPAAIPMFNPHMIGLTLLSDAEPSVSFGGEFADEITGSHAFTAGDWLAHAPDRAWSVGIDALPKAIKRIDLLRRGPLADRLSRWRQPIGRLDSWLHRDIHREWNEERTRIEAKFHASQYQLANPFLWAYHREFDWQPMHWEWCVAQGARRIHPFASSRNVALALSSHPSERLGRHDKLFSRNAFARDFPRELLGRRDKGGHEKPAPATVTSEAWQRCLARLSESWLELVDPVYTAAGAGALVNEGETLRNLTRLGDLPERLAFFSQNVYKIREDAHERPT